MLFEGVEMHSRINLNPVMFIGKLACQINIHIYVFGEKSPKYISSTTVYIFVVIFYLLANVLLTDTVAVSLKVETSCWSDTIKHMFLL